MAIVQMEAARAKDLGCEIELLSPIVNDGPAEESLRSGVHFDGDVFGDLHEDGIAIDGEFEVPLIVERH